MSVSSQPEIELTVTPNAGVEVKKFMDAEGVTAEEGGLRVSVQPGGCSGFKYSLVIDDRSRNLARPQPERLKGLFRSRPPYSLVGGSFFDRRNRDQCADVHQHPRSRLH